ncbi:papain-like cysteine protease family protein [Anabaena azotica]|uniref:C39 family peptidase n=1 Tax=Anabaena azotica FACHB-119 TaxID=947527 RepID=A0ABR8D9N9_9NOST|nr:papain-like cysteine protease family protein [Anabaena azotica]MBD2502912.1 C39 family peptidase [Anabaena azotica FACHB-119]
MAELNFTIYPQKNTNWCWAACSYSVAKFYDPATAWTQATIVNAELGRTDCEVNGSSAACNKPWYLDKALTRVGYFYKFYSGVPSLASVEAELANNTPMGARIGWNGGGGHFVVISGATTSTGYVTIQDPWGGVTKNIKYDTFCKSYENSGQLTHRYETKL